MHVSLSGADFSLQHYDMQTTTGIRALSLALNRIQHAAYARAILSFVKNMSNARVLTLNQTSARLNQAVNAQRMLLALQQAGVDTILPRVFNQLRSAALSAKMQQTSTSQKSALELQILNSKHQLELLKHQAVFAMLTHSQKTVRTSLSYAALRTWREGMVRSEIERINSQLEALRRVNSEQVKADTDNSGFTSCEIFANKYCNLI